MKAVLPPAVARAGDAPAVESPRRIGIKRLAALRAAFYREFWPYLPLALAILAIVGMLAGLVAWDNTRRRPLWIDVQETNVLMADSSHLSTVLVIFVCALAGVVIGVFQGLADRAPALWGFIKHRPGGTVLPFAARVLAGLALYFIAAGIPVALLLIYAATHAMPFEWHFILPTSADFLGGVVWYLAGLLAVERHASIFGSRLLPMVGAVICTGAVCAVPQFAQALLVIGLAAAVYGAAAWGAQGWDGFRLRAPVLAQVGLGVVLLAGVAVIPVGALWCAEHMETDYEETEWDGIWNMPQWRSPEIGAYIQAWRNRPAPVQVSYGLLSDASLVKRIFTEPLNSPNYYGGYAPDEYATYERLDPQSTPYRGTLEHWEDPDGGSSGDVRVVSVADALPFYPLAERAEVREGYRDLSERAVTRGKNDHEYWSYVGPAGLFQLYDDSGRYLGSLGREGFAPPGTRAVPFGRPWSDFSAVGGQMGLVPGGNGEGTFTSPVGESGTFAYTTPQGIFEVDLARRTVGPRWLFPTGVRLMGYSASSTPMVLGSDRLYIYNAADRAHPALEVPLAFSADMGGISVWYAPYANRWAIWYRKERSIDIYDHAWQKAIHIDVPMTYHQVLDEPPPPAWLIGALLRQARGAAARRGILGAVGGPWCVLGGGPGETNQMLGDRWMYEEYRYYRPWFLHGLGPYPWSVSGAWYFMAAGAVLLAGAAGMFFLARRYGVRFRALWIGGALALGPVMLLLLPCLHRLPRRVVCAACHKRRLTTAARCGHCGAGFGGPAAQGIEIFTPVSGGGA